MVSRLAVCPRLKRRAPTGPASGSFPPIADIGLADEKGAPRYRDAPFHQDSLARLRTAQTKLKGMNIPRARRKVFPHGRLVSMAKVSCISPSSYRARVS